MTRHNLLKIVLPRILITLCLLELVSACGSTTHSTPGITPSTNPISAQNFSLPQPNIGKALSLDLAGLLHIEVNPVGCTPNGYINSNLFVLASNRLKYDNGEIQQMYSFLKQIIRRVVFGPGGKFYFDDPPAPPATLNETSGGLVGKPEYPTCTGVLQITNIANSAIQIKGVNLRLLSDAQPNLYQYRLIDFCSLPSGVVGGPCPGLGGNALIYPYNFNLSIAKAGTVFSGQPLNGQPLLDPNQVAFIPLYFYSSENLIYSIAPEITLSLVDEQRTITLSQLTSTLSFAKPDQFTCYQQQANTYTFSQIDFRKGWCL